jgi:hypothetical protein
MKIINRLFTTIVYSGGLVLFLILYVLFLNRIVKADVFTLEDVSISYKDYISGRSPLITQNGLEGAKLGQEFNLNLNTNIYDVIYWENIIHTTTDKYDNHNGQFRLVGWQLRFGLRLTENFDIGYYHHSQHLLDYVYPYGKFPYEDAVELKIYLYKRPKGQESLIW